ncbi:MAG: anthranilate phosphoribosyltransferase [Candidatus Omnitrophica bacterium]|nr:anthranilate phosphoribosyltransferase [Candidatus Omnitrophota bacterium]MCM8793339.1 anthranilate phosphoribosyltransferase [Candidatus Omnitrophota bacterium]
MIKEAIAKLVEKKDLTPEEMTKAMEEIMTGEALPGQIASFLTALRMKGETIEEITAAAEVMRKYVVRIKVDSAVIFDACGTGGDGLHTFNISTVSALVIAGGGVTVAKHGNRSVSSRCGSADLMEALGINIEVAPEVIERCLREVGIGFLFAPRLHPAMKYATPVRREMGIRTIFNLLGPLTNPAGATHQLLGIYDKNLGRSICQVLGNLGSKHSLVVHGLDGLDEVSTTTETLIWEWDGKKIKEYKISPEDFGIRKSTLEQIKTEDLETNKRIALQILEGEKGPHYDIVVLNAGCGFYAADKVKGIQEGIDLAREVIDSGKAKEKLELLGELCHK